jgi:hypothetical protein
MGNDITPDTNVVLLKLPTGEAAYFQRRTTWDFPDRPLEPETNLVAVFYHLPLTESLDLSEASTITVCPDGQTAFSSNPTRTSTI